MTSPTTRLAAFTAAVLLPIAPAIAAEPVTGRWLTHNAKAIVAIEPCGASLCGRIARILVPAKSGQTADVHNPDRALRDRPILGLAVLTGFTAEGDEWRGRIYDPQKGTSYRSTLRLNPDGTLKVRGCVALFCKSFTWTRPR